MTDSTPHPPVRPSLWKRLRDYIDRSLPMALARRFGEAELMTQAAALSFYTLLSLAPLLVLLLWLITALYPSAQQALVAQVTDFAGSEFGTVVDTVIRNADAEPNMGSLAGLWSTVLLLVGATAVFARLQTALNLIFRNAQGPRSGLLAWLRKRVFSFGVVLALGFLLIVSMSMSTLLQFLFSHSAYLLPAINYTATILLYSGAFAALYHYLPDRRVGWRRAFRGGVATAVLFTIGRYGIDLYLFEAAPGSAFGSMGTLVVMLIWMYYATLVFFVGALFTAVLDERAAARRRIRDADADTMHSEPVPSFAPDGPAS